MIFPIVSGLIYSIKRRTVMELYSPSYRKLWKEWDLRAMLLLSLTLQILLSILGNRRKNNRKLWIRVVVWSAYIGADSVATFSLGILSSNITDMYGDNTESIDGNTQLTAFWAPFLLLHLGGPDSITAYALEDNELWLRHLLGLVVQTGMALYVFLMAWTGSSLSFLSLTMFFPGLIKYGERTWVLRSASNKKRRNSMLRKHDFNIKDNILHDDYKVKIDAGYVVGVDRIVEVQLPVDLSGSDNNNSISDEDKLLTAYGLLNISKRLFVDATLNSRDRDTGHTIFRNLLSEDAFKVIEMELGLIYELLYTKMSLFYTPWGLVLRLITFFITSSVLVLFAFLVYPNSKYSKIDLHITLVLMVVAIITEIHAALVLLSSDRFAVWLSTHRRTSTMEALTCFPPNRTPRWSNNMPQYSLLCLNRKAKPLVSKIYPNYAIKRDRWSQWNTKNIPEDLRKLVYHYFKQKAEEATTTGNVAFTALPTIPGGGEEDSGQSPVEEFDYSIIIWHIATEVWYYTDKENISTDNGFLEKCKSSKQISRYMMYLLVEHASMLSVEILSQINIQDVSAEAQNSSIEIASEAQDSSTEIAGEAQDSSIKIAGVRSKTVACYNLLRQFKHGAFLGSRAQYGETHHVVLENAGDLVLQMNNSQQSFTKKWDTIGCAWLEMLAYAASRCKANEHAQQLRRGGEFLTHVWLLLAHFGLTDHVRIISAQPRPLARLFAK